MDIKNYKEPLVSIGILDYNRPSEAHILLQSLKLNAKFEHKVVYVSNGGEQEYVKKFHNEGLIDALILNKSNIGCGLGTRQLFQSCMTEWVMYVQVDQFLGKTMSQSDVDQFINLLETQKNLLHIDLAGDQGHSKYSERAHLINRKRYLSIPNLDKTIGGPGPYANYQWTENLVQEHMKDTNLSFLSYYFFGDNGKVSQRSYPCGAETVHFCDEKRVFILKPFKKRYDDFPNLKLNDAEWKMAMEETFSWPQEGLIPEADKPHSFIYWK